MRWKCNPGIDLHNHWQTLVCIQVFRNHKSIILRWKNHPSYFTNWLWSFLASLKKAWVCLMFFFLLVERWKGIQFFPRALREAEQQLSITPLFGRAQPCPFSPTNQPSNNQHKTHNTDITVKNTDTQRRDEEHKGSCGSGMKARVDSR